MVQSDNSDHIFIRVALIFIGAKMIMADDRFGPEPKLINDAGQNTNAKAAFRTIGNYAAHTSVISIRATYPLQYFMDAKNNHFEKVNDFSNKYELHRASQITDIHKQVIREDQQELADIMSALPQSLPRADRRQKRFFGIAIGTAALGFAAANRFSITKQEAQIATLNKKTDFLVKIEHLNADHLKHIDDRQTEVERLMSEIYHDNTMHLSRTCSYAEHHFEQTTRMTAELIDSAMRHRLAPGAIHVKAMRQMVQHTKEVADKHGYINYVNNPSDLYQVEVSSVYHPDDKIFVLILHIPLVHPGNLMTLMQFIPLPLIHNATHNFTLTPEVGTKDLLAIGSTNFFNTLSTSDLANCIHLGDTFFCRGRRELRTDIESDCLPALYFGDTEHIRAQCQFRITKTKEQIFEMKENVWAVYSTGTIATNQLCPGRKTEPLKISSGDLVKVKPGCSVRTTQHVLIADDEESLDIDPELDQWKWSLEHLFPEHEPKNVVQAIAALHGRGGQTVDSAALLAQLDEMSQPDTHWTFTFPAILIAGTILLALSGLLYCYCKKKSGRELPIDDDIVLRAPGTAPPAYTAGAKPEPSPASLPIRIVYG